MSENETITLYTFSIFTPGLFGGKRSTKPDIVPLPDYAKWRNKSLQTGIGYNINKSLEPVHQDMKIIIAIQYQPYPPLRDLATEMALKVVKFISALFKWIVDTYKSLLAGGIIKEDVWWITTQVIRSSFKDYPDLECSAAAKTSFDSDYQLRSTLIWRLIKGHLAADKILVKSIKDHPIAVGAYAQCLVSNSIRKEAMDAKVMTTKLKDKVDELPSSTTSSANSINELKTSVAYSNKSSGTAISKLGSLAKK